MDEATKETTDRPLEDWQEERKRADERHERHTAAVEAQSRAMQRDVEEKWKRDDARWPSVALQQERWTTAQERTAAALERIADALESPNA